MCGEVSGRECDSEEDEMMQKDRSLCRKLRSFSRTSASACQKLQSSTFSRRNAKRKAGKRKIYERESCA